MIANNLANAFVHRLSSKIARTVQVGSGRRSGLTSGGERVDIVYTVESIGPWPSLWRRMDIYEQTHYSRYVFASYSARSSDACADLACGTGYGSALLSEVCQSVLGVDRNRVVAEAANSVTNTGQTCGLSAKTCSCFNLIPSLTLLCHLRQSNILLSQTFRNS
jgi:SAM-dependent methyltransferase